MVGGAKKITWGPSLKVGFGKNSNLIHLDLRETLGCQFEKVSSSQNSESVTPVINSVNRTCFKLVVLVERWLCPGLQPGLHRGGGRQKAAGQPAPSGGNSSHSLHHNVEALDSSFTTRLRRS